MRALLATLLGTIAVGLLLIAYGLLSPRIVAGVPMSPIMGDSADPYRLARPVNQQYETIGIDRYGSPVAMPVSYVVREPYVTTEAAAVGQPRAVRTNQTASYPAQRRSAARTEGAPGRDWKKTALVIGGSTATGAGVGAIFGGKKGALIGAAIGGGASTLWEAKR